MWQLVTAFTVTYDSNTGLYTFTITTLLDPSLIAIAKYDELVYELTPANDGEFLTFGDGDGTKLLTDAGEYVDFRKSLLDETTPISVNNDTITIKLADGTTKSVSISDANTWRPVQNNLTSTSTSDSLSAYQGKLLNDNKLNKSGGTMTGDLTTTSGSGNGIFIGSGGTNITSVTPSSKDVTIQNLAQRRFGSS